MDNPEFGSRDAVRYFSLLHKSRPALGPRVPGALSPWDKAVRT
jgi:hypothetical protein